MEVFDINKYISKYVMHTKTKKEYDDFCEYLDSIGRRWISGRKYTEEHNFSVYGEDTCINFNGDVFGAITYYKDHNYTILEMEDFIMPKKQFTKADLKTGDVVKYRDGIVNIVIKELGVLITPTGWNNLDNYEADLTSRLDKRFDIVAVRRPSEKYHCVFDKFDTNRGNLVYEREEVTEMTLEQICKLLGKNIKIVKG